MMKKTIISFALLAAMTFGAGSAIADHSKPLAIVELYTSQGCSSCPPADAFIGELAERSDVLPLSFHVDYWDYIGWKDQFAQRDFTLRQRDYARTFDLRYVYTPQVVLSGQFETSGNQRKSILRAIDRQLNNHEEIELISTKDRISISGPSRSSSTKIYHVSYKPEVTTEVRRGENRGRTLTNYNIVVSLDELGQYNGGEQEILISQDSLDPALAHAIFVQRNDNLAIVAAVKLP